MTLQTVYSFQANDLHTGKRNFEALHQRSFSSSSLSSTSTTNIADVQNRSAKRLCILSNGNHRKKIMNDTIASGNKRLLKEGPYNDLDNDQYKKSRHCYNYHSNNRCANQESMVISDDDQSVIKARKNQGNDDVWNHIGIG